MRIEWPGRFVRAIGGRFRVAQRVEDQGPAVIRSFVKGRVIGWGEEWGR